MSSINFQNLFKFDTVSDEVSFGNTENPMSISSEGPGSFPDGIGIGTIAAPATGLHLQFADSKSQIRLDNTGTGGRDWSAFSSSDANTVSGGKFVISDNTADEPRLTIDGSGHARFYNNLTVSGNFYVNGTTTTINSTTLSIDDKNIELGKGSGSEGNDAAMDGAGITVKSSNSDKTILWNNANDAWQLNQHLVVNSGGSANALGKIFTDDQVNLTLGSGAGTKPRIYLKGISNGQADAGDIYMASAGASNSLVIEAATGNVGIGTDSPGATLEVQATDNSVGAYAFWVVSKDHQNSIITAKENGDVQMGNFFYDDSTGNVGIGSSDPSSFDAEADNLVVKGPEVGVGITIVTDSSNAGERGNIYFADGANGSDQFRGGVTYDHTDDDLSFRTAGTERVWVGNDGNVTIGDGSDSSWIKLASADGSYQIGAASITGPEKYFSIYDTEAADHRLYISESGNVGIGTDHPDAPLEIKGPDGPVTTSNDAIVIRAASTAHILTMGTDSSTGTSWIRPVQEGVSNNKLLLDATEVGISSSETIGLKLVNPDSAAANDSNDPPAILFQANGWDTNAGSEEYRARIRVKGGYSGAAGRGNTHPVIHFDLETNEDNPDDALSTRMVINADGNVGIGTDLNDIDSGFGLSIHNRDGILVRNFQGALNSQTNIIRGSISDRYDQDDWGVGINQVCESNSNGFGMAFCTRNAYNGSYSEKVRIDKDGKVGIGTIQPAHPLDVSDGTVNFKINPITGHVTAGTEAQIGTSSNHDLTIQTNNTTRMTIESDGTVKIGTHEVIHEGNIGTYAQTTATSDTWRGVTVDTSGNGSANATLGSAETLMLKKGSNVSLAEADGVVTISATNTTYSVGNGGLTQNNFTNDDHTKLNGIAASANNYSHPTGDGNKHIPTGGSAGEFLKYSSSGTAVWETPSYTTNTWRGVTAGGNTLGSSETLAFKEGSNISISEAAGEVTISASASSSFNPATDAGDLDFTGTNVVIGVEAAAANDFILEVKGKNGAGQSIIAAGDVIGMNQASDDRLKTNTNKIDNALDKVASLEGFSFDWNDAAKEVGITGEEQVGLSAQTLEKVLPQVVKGLPNSDYKMVDYQKVVPLLVEAIKELKSEIEELKSK